jgi:hypothetical protein
MDVILPCAGLSTRFPNLRPKYLLTDYSGQLMIENAVKNYLGKDRVTIAILKEHDVMFNASKKLRDAFGFNVNIIMLDKRTSGPADTVYQAISRSNINLQSQILIKDCDGFYDADETEGNVIYVSKLSNNPDIRNAPAKSYTITNEQNIVAGVVEKQIVSNSFCVGGYQFAKAADYLNAFETLKGMVQSEVFVSNVIDYMICEGSVFFQSEVRNFIDVGTADDWFRYNNKPTYFCDIDGTIFVNGEYSSSPEILYNNVDALLKEMSRGCKIVFCTARPQKYESITRKALDKIGFIGCPLIMEVNHSSRVLINDYAASNPYPSAVAINLPRNSDTLGDMI